MELATVDKRVNVGSIAAVIVLGLLLASSTQQEPYSKTYGPES